jgi:hypothetical protein
MRFRQEAKTALLFRFLRSRLPLAHPAFGHVAEVQQQLHLTTKQEGKRHDQRTPAGTALTGLILDLFRLNNRMLASGDRLVAELA